MAWCTWSDRATRAVQLLAHEWYGVSDVTQLESHGPRERSTKSGTEANTTWRDPELAYEAVNAEVRHGQEEAFEPALQGGQDPLSFLYYTSTPSLFIDDVIKEWLEEGQGLESQLRYM